MSSAEVLTVEGVDIGLVDILALGSATESLKLSGFSIPVPVLMSILEFRLVDGLPRRSIFGLGTAVVLSSCVEGKGAREPSAMTG